MDVRVKTWFARGLSISTISESQQNATEVRCESIQSMVKRLNLPRIDVLMVDIEGAEVIVLSTFPWNEVEFGRIYCELHPEEWKRFDSTAKDFGRLLDEQDLACFDMYLNPYEKISHFDYVGPTVLLSRSTI